MSITIYPPQCGDFSTNGLGILTPIECTIEEYAAGMCELKLVHPIDEERRWAQIGVGCLLRAPMPVRESPLYSYIEGAGEGPQQVTRGIWEVEGTTVGAYMRAGPGMRYKNYGYLQDGARVTEIGRQQSGETTWLHVVVQRGGRECWMSAKWLRQVGSYTETVQGGQVVGPRSVEIAQSRDQLFRIRAVEVDTQAGTVTATAQHIFYDLRGNLLNFVYQAKEKSAAEVVADVCGMLLNESDFHIQALNLSGQITADYGFRSPVEILLDPDEGIVAQTGALLIRDNYDVYLLPDVVRDTGVTVRRGKNLVGVRVTSDLSGVVTRIVPEGKLKDGKPFYIPDASGGSLRAGHVDSPRIGDYPTIQAKRIEYDVKQVERDPDNVTTFTDAGAALRRLQQLAERDFSENGIDLPSYGMDVDFVRLQEPEAYAALQSVHLYDSIHVIDELIGLKAKVRVTGYVWDALALQYQRVILGQIESLERMVYSFNLPAGGISGTKIAPGSASGAILRDLSVEYAKISVAAIEQLSAESIDAITARIQEIVANSVTTDRLYAALAALNRAVIESAEIDWAQIGSLKAAVAQLAEAAIGSAEIDFAQVRDLLSGTAIIERGEAGKLFISRLAMTEANLVSLTAGELVVKGVDGRFYALSVDARGEVQAQLKQVNNEDVRDLSIDAGEKLIEGSVTAACLNATEIFADSAVIRELIAANLDVGTLFAREAFLSLLRTSKIVGDRTLELVVRDAEAARDAAAAAQAGADANSNRLDRLGEDAVTFPDLERRVRLDAQGLHVGDSQTASEALIDSGGMSVVVDGVRYSRFAADYAQFGNYQLGIHPQEGGLVIRPV